MNSFSVTGFLASDAEIKDIQTKKGDQIALASFRMGFRGIPWDKDSVVWCKVTVWGKQAEFVARLQKGAKVAVSGSLQQEKWVGKDGAEKTGLVINAKDVEDLTPRRAARDEGEGDGRGERRQSGDHQEWDRERDNRPDDVRGGGRGRNSRRDDRGSRDTLDDQAELPYRENDQGSPAQEGDFQEEEMPF